MIEEKNLNRIDPSTFRYAGLYDRLNAKLLDGLIFLPFYLIWFWLGYKSSLINATTFLVFLSLLYWLYNIYFNARWGQTLGKMWRKIRIVSLDGTKISVWQAILRSIVDIILGILIFTFYIHSLIKYPELNNREAGIDGFFKFLDKHYSQNRFYAICRWASTIWGWSEIIVFFANKKRRAIHDFIAGTVVVHTEPPKKGKDWIPEYGGTPKRCPRCQKGYPSEFYFRENGLCINCDDGSSDTDGKSK